MLAGFPEDDELLALYAGDSQAEASHSWSPATWCVSTLVLLLAWYWFSLSTPVAATSVQGAMLTGNAEARVALVAAPVVSVAYPNLATPPGQHTILLDASDITIPGTSIDAILATYSSPAVGSGNDWVELGKQYGIDPMYGIAFFVMESTAGTAQGWAGWKPDGSSTHNIGNIICAGYPTCYGRFRDYGSWREGIEDWFQLLSVEYIQGRGAHTLEQIIPIYAPAFENDVPNYVATVTRLHTEYDTK